LTPASRSDSEASGQVRRDLGLRSQQLLDAVTRLEAEQVDSRSPNFASLLLEGTHLGRWCAGLLQGLRVGACLLELAMSLLQGIDPAPVAL